MAGLHFSMLCVVVMLVSLVHSGPIRRIVNGQPLPRGDWPWLVSFHFLPEFKYKNLQSLDHVCMGGLIDPSWILTAGHCFSDLLAPGLSNASNWIAVLGEHHRRVAESSEQNIAIEKIFYSPLFCLNPFFTGDIALIKLSRPAQLNNYVNPIAFDEGISIPVGTECRVAGWGQHTEGELGNGTMVPHFISMMKDTKRHCWEVLRNESFRIDDNVICFTSNEPKSSCQGDSGAPLLCQKPSGRNVVSGIVNGGPSCGVANSTTVYARVSSHAFWIREIMSLN